jgi:hypothetical protein
MLKLFIKYKQDLFKLQTKQFAKYLPLVLVFK